MSVSIQDEDPNSIVYSHVFMLPMYRDPTSGVLSYFLEIVHDPQNVYLRSIYAQNMSISQVRERFRVHRRISHIETPASEILCTFFPDKEFIPREEQFTLVPCHIFWFLVCQLNSIISRSLTTALFNFMMGVTPLN